MHFHLSIQKVQLNEQSLLTCQNHLAEFHLESKNSMPCKVGHTPRHVWSLPIAKQHTHQSWFSVQLKLVEQMQLACALQASSAVSMSLALCSMVRHITPGKWVARQADHRAEVLQQLLEASSPLQLVVMVEVPFEFLLASPVLLD